MPKGERNGGRGGRSSQIGIKEERSKPRESREPKRDPEEPKGPKDPKTQRPKAENKVEAECGGERK